MKVYWIFDSSSIALECGIEKSTETFLNILGACPFSIMEVTLLENCIKFLESSFLF